MKNPSELNQEYLAKQKNRMASYVIGATNPAGQKIKKIYAKGDEYLIYDIEDSSPIESLRVLIDTREEVDEEPINRFNEVKDEFDKFKSVIFKTNADSSYKHRAASAITVAIKGNSEKSKALFKSITEEMLNEFRERLYGRIAYFGGAVFLVVILSGISILGYIFRDNQFVKMNYGLFEYLVATTFAGFGGLLSVSIRIKELFIEKALNNKMYFLYGAERLIFSILGGIAALTLLKGEIIFSAFLKSTAQIYVILSVCFVSGFSETLIPNTLKKFEERNSENSN